MTVPASLNCRGCVLRCWVCAVPVLIVLMACSTVSWALDAGDNDRAVIIARLQGLRNLSAEFDVQDFYTPRPRNDDASPTTLPFPFVKTWLRQGPEAYHQTFRFLEGRVLSDRVISKETRQDSETTGHPRLARQITSYGDGRVELYYLSCGQSHGTGSIQATFPVPEEWTLELALGLRLYRHSEFLDAKSLENAIVVSEPQVARLSLRDGHGLLHSWTFDKTQAYALTDYAVARRNGQVFHSVKASDFQLVGNIMLPRNVVRKGYVFEDSGEQWVPMTFTLSAIKYTVPDRENVPEKFLVVWPKGTYVRDGRANVDLGTMERDQKFDDAAIDAELRRRETAKADLLNKTQDRVNRILEASPSIQPATRPAP